VYPRIVAPSSDTNTDTANKTTIPIRHAAVGYDASVGCAVCRLACVAEVAALAIARGVDVLVARLRIGLHCGEWQMPGVVNRPVGEREEKSRVFCGVRVEQPQG
jgi:hypothetical protein